MRPVRSFAAAAVAVLLAAPLTAQPPAAAPAAASPEDALLGALRWRNIGPANMMGRIVAVEDAVHVHRGRRRVEVHEQRPH
ncbi:MAG: hypothetical protein RLZ32_2905, partial [Gemmatimonadota bacterium]